MSKRMHRWLLAVSAMCAAAGYASLTHAAVVATSDFTGVPDAPGSNSLNGHDHWTLSTGNSFGTVDIVNEEITLNAQFPPVVYNWDARWGFRTDAGANAPPVGSIYNVSYTGRADTLAGVAFPPVLFVQVNATAGFDVVTSTTFRMNESGWGVDLDFAGGIDPTSPLIGAGETGLVEFVINGTAGPHNSQGSIIDPFQVGVFLTNTSTTNTRQFVGQKFLGNVTDPGNTLRLVTFGDGWAGTFDNFSVDVVPEPTSGCLLFGGISAFALFRRSRCQGSFEAARHAKK